MNELKRANRLITGFINCSFGLEDGISRVKSDLRNSFHFWDTDRFSRQLLRDSYQEFEVWLNRLLVSNPLPDGITALNFGLYQHSGVLYLYLSGSRRWSMNDPDWACDTFYLPDAGQIELPVFKDILTIFSEFNHAGLYLSIALMSMLIRDYTHHSAISLLDNRRKTLHIACGYDDGDLYYIGRLNESGLHSPGRSWPVFL